jgi:hypothetical protein
VRLGPAHEERAVGMLAHRDAVERGEKARPAGAGIEFGVGEEQWGAATDAAIGAGALPAPERAGKGAFGAVLVGDVTLRRRQSGAPFPRSDLTIRGGALVVELMPVASYWGERPASPPGGPGQKSRFGLPLHLFLNGARAIGRDFGPSASIPGYRGVSAVNARAHEIWVLLYKNLCGRRFVLSYSCLQLKRIVNTAGAHLEMPWGQDEAGPGTAGKSSRNCVGQGHE